MQAYYKLQWKKIGRSWVLYFSFIGSIVLMYLLSSIFTFGVSLPGIIILNTIIIALFSFGSDLFELKNSTVFKTIGGSGLTKSKLLLSSVMFSLTIVVLSSYWILLWAAIFDQTSISADTISFAVFDALVQEIDDSLSGVIEIENPVAKLVESLGFYPFVNAIPWQSFDWITFNYSILISTILASFVAIVFVILSSSSKTYATFAFVYLFIGLYAGGLFIPPRLSEDSQFLNMMSVVYPHSYIVDFFSTSMGVSFSAPIISSIPSTEGNTLIILPVSPWDFSYRQNIVNLIMPVLFTSIFGLVGFLKFRWS